MNFPLVTCLCLTRNRPEWLPKAIAQFQASTYPNREMLILNSGEPVDVSPDPRIRVVRAAHGNPLGTLRNAGVMLSNGDIIAHWDDDDYSAPGRLHDQVSRLLDSGKKVTGYYSMIFESETERWMFTALSSFAIGTSLCYWRDWAKEHPFPAIHVAEDRYFSNEARDRKELVSVPAGDMMRASIHPGNTSPRQLKGDNWQLLPKKVLTCNQ